MADDGKERIYVGGLDPSRGLTVELVASRLRSVEGVDILSVNDIAIHDDKHQKKHGKEALYYSKKMIVDEDGDLVDTRNFFYVEARAAATEAEAEAASTTSALDLIAKQYGSVKWKGCQLRVEAARPHILKRLEDERASREVKPESNESLQNDEEDDDQTKEEKAVKKDRRRLRIRKRFGEEAFRVDTRPHPLEISQRATAWHEFATLHKRMHDKRESQQKKLIERRKKERRLWASGKGNMKEDPVSAECDELNSLMFLNRGIHIRFHDAALNQGGERRVATERVLKPVKIDAGDEETVSSSSVASSDSSDSEQSSEHEVEASGESKNYVWSDDDDDDDDEEATAGEDQKSTGEEESVDVTDEKPKSEGHSDLFGEGDDSKDDTHDGQSNSSEDDEQKYQDLKKNNNRSAKKLMSGAEYTKAATIDEFSGGMDFDDSSGNVGGYYSDDSEYDNDLVSDARLENGLEDDIHSNIGVLASLFPDSHFNKQLLAASITGDHHNEDGTTGVDEAGKMQNSSSLFGAGMIMQRYDPTKEDKKIEMASAEKDDVGSAEPPQEEQSNDAEGNENKSKEDAVSSESSDEEQVDEEPAAEDGGDGEKSTISTNVEENTVPAKDVYEQDKLEDVFKQAREGKTESFSMANLFSSEEAAKGDVYEQDKLEGVFKVAREDVSKNAAAVGFTFGFQSEVQDSKANEGGETTFSFGFDVKETTGNEKDQVNPQENSEIKPSNNDEVESEAVQPATTMNATDEESKNVSTQRKRRVGMVFPESDLDKYEDMFFSLNEGPRILKDFNAMKQDEENQELWQKERLVLTADWKRKQKSASSRKGKKVRR